MWRRALLLLLVFCLQAGGRGALAAFEERELSAGSWRTTVRTVAGSSRGPVFYLIAGIHGDEPAGALAAERLVQEGIEAGTLHVLSRANPDGLRLGSRFFNALEDLNRCFPGNGAGSPGQRAARSIFEDIRACRPALVLDLHEAGPPRPGEDDLRNALVCAHPGAISGAVADFLLGPGSSFGFFNAPPEHSLNREVSSLLGIPVITVESSRGDPLNRRVETHLFAVRYLLNRFSQPGAQAVKDP